MKKILSAFLFFLALAGHAQQDPAYSQYMFNVLAVNPAYAGSREVLSVTALNRSQWVGLDGAPSTQTFSMHTALGTKNGIGLQIINDRVGLMKNTGVSLSYAYRIRMEKSALSFGLQAGVNSYRNDLSSVDVASSGAKDPSFAQNVSKVSPNIGFGIYYTTDRFYLSASLPHLLRNTLTESPNSTTRLVARQFTHYMLLAGYSVSFSENFRWNPSFLLKGANGAPSSLDINSIFWFRNFLGIGASYRIDSDVVAMLQIQPTDQLRIGYAYDYGLSDLSDHYSGTHEIMVRYEMSFGKEKVVGPRNF